MFFDHLIRQYFMWVWYVFIKTLLFRYCLMSLDWPSWPLSVTRRETEILKAPQIVLYYKGFIVILNHVHPLCFCVEEIVEYWCGNNFCAEVAPLLCWITEKKWLVLGALAEPSGSGSRVLLLTFFIWLRGKTVFDLHCGEAGRQLGFGPKQRVTELKRRSWQSQGCWRSMETHKDTLAHVCHIYILGMHTHAGKYINTYMRGCMVHFFGHRIQKWPRILLHYRDPQMLLYTTHPFCILCLTYTLQTCLEAQLIIASFK